jgi:hypothetical protein
MSINKKLNFGRNMNSFTENKIADAMQMAGKILPAEIVSQSGKMVTVSFLLRDIPYTLPHVTIPLFGPQYIRYPMQPGDRGIVIPADTYLGGVSGLGGGTADLTPPANLGALVFLPISNTEWQDVDGEVVTIYGPEGITLRDASSNTTFLLTPDSITIAAPSSFKVTVGDTILNLTPAGWSLSGASGSIVDEAGNTSPAIMQAAWSALTSWANSHVHTNGNGGSNTGAATTKLTAEIVE